MNNQPENFVGIDVGASTTKAIIINADKEILVYSVNNTGADYGAAAEKAFANACRQAGTKGSDRYLVMATGYGKRNVPRADDTKTEISCHARGAFHYFPKDHTLIDIGGQDNKIVKTDRSGKRVNFKMNRKCAAGTGAFLEEIAYRLDIKMDKLNQLAEKAQHDVHIGSYCTVFAATEILARIREGAKVEDIVKGIFGSVVKRVLEMDTMDGNVVMTGGVVAYNPFLVSMFEEKIGRKIFVPPHPQFTGALGAALYSLESKGGINA
ncbi:MAG: ATPase [Candidatus Zixiibacteriota bacterium]|nr:MAG: ATPase [candidate division Zixibacteria bacterium]